MVAFDFDMNGVAPEGTYQGWPEGQYVCRIENTERKPDQDRFDKVTGAPMPGNGFNASLDITLGCYDGPNAGQKEHDFLSLWNTDKQRSDIAKSRLKSIQIATGIESPDSSHLHGRWLLVEIKKNTKGYHNKHYSALPPAMIPQNVPPLHAAAPAPAAYAPAPAYAPQPQQQPQPAVAYPQPQQVYAPQPQQPAYAPAPVYAPAGTVPPGAPPGYAPHAQPQTQYAQPHGAAPAYAPAPAPQPQQPDPNAAPAWATK